MASLNFNYDPKRLCLGCMKDKYCVLEIAQEDKLYCRVFGSCKGCDAWEISHDNGCFEILYCSENTGHKNWNITNPAIVSDSNLFDLQENQQCPSCKCMTAVIVHDTTTTFDGDHKYICCQNKDCKYQDIQK